MTFYGLWDRHRFAVNGILLAGFVFGCFVFGVLSVRQTTEGLILTGALFCFVVYLVKPEAMIWVTLFAAFAALPEGLNVGKVIGPMTLWVYQVAAVLAICFLIPSVRPRFSDFVLPGIFVLTVAYATVTGFATDQKDVVVWRESTTIFEVALGFVLAMLIVYGNHVKSSMRAMIIVLWFSAGMAVLSSVAGLQLAGRAESLAGTTGATQAVRFILTTQTAATAVLSALVAATIVCRVRPILYLALGLPTVLISLLSFSRNTLIAMAVAGLVAFLGSMSWAAVRRALKASAIGLAVIAAAVPGILILLQQTKTGIWLSDQLTAFSGRVLQGISSNALAADESAQARVREFNLLKEIIPEAPVFGHGLGYAYQGPNNDDEFGTIFYPAYSENFYMWWLAKAGAVGMAAFALLALTPVVLALRCASAPAKISAAVVTSLLAVSIVWPLPEQPHDALAIGMAMGAAMGFARLPRRNQNASDASANAAPVSAALPVSS
ncbi:O-antigen ligase family protein [Mycobacterium barrassiae]|uniref:O-antigen ligase family protein n=1 Tax=Mycobacterium barrassiae TaxID=319709 RepID=UPI002265E685|nr:O-antigen ligase family protein [Mycobacterium barrassiae]MCV7302826.1 O-antigen ligase family protein [Mycobacterium barrassiae]